MGCEGKVKYFLRFCDAYHGKNPETKERFLTHSHSPNCWLTSLPILFYRILLEPNDPHQPASLGLLKCSNGEVKRLGEHGLPMNNAQQLVLLSATRDRYDSTRKDWDFDAQQPWDLSSKYWDDTETQ